MRTRADKESILSATRRMVTNPRGASAVEYIIMIILAAMIILGAMKVFGPMVRSRYKMGVTGIETMEDDPLASNTAPVANSGSSSSSKTPAKQSGSSSSPSSSSSGGVAVENSGSSSGGSESGPKENVNLSDDPFAAPSDEEEGRKFPIVLIIAAIGLVGLLLYVMFGNKKG